MHWLFKHYRVEDLMAETNRRFKRNYNRLFNGGYVSQKEEQRLAVFFDELEVIISKINTRIERLHSKSKPLDKALMQSIAGRETIYLWKTSNFLGNLQRRSEGALEGAKIIQNPIEEIEASNHMMNQQIYMKNTFLCYGISSCYFYAIENFAKLWLSINDASFAKEITNAGFYKGHSGIRKELEKRSDLVSKNLLKLYVGTYNLRTLTDYDALFVFSNCELLVPTLKKIVLGINLLSKNSRPLYEGKLRKIVKNVK